MSIVRSIKDVTRPVRRWAATSIYSHPRAPQDFDHRTAQGYELEHNSTTIAENHIRLTEALNQEKQRNGLWINEHSEWFDGDHQAWRAYVDFIRDKKCLEIGCGPIGELAFCYWIKDRVIIDPLVDQYRERQLAINGETLFTPDVATYAVPAEEPIVPLKGMVDGAIICRNALDHCEDPLAVLLNISDYAAPGCYLLLWTDIWHVAGLDMGHRNITRSEAAMDRMLNGLGFEIVRSSRGIRDPVEYIEYGRVGRKRAG